MNKIILISVMMLTTASMYAQSSSQSEDTKTIELRQKIGIEYSMPDFTTSRLDGNVIGDRLAKMLKQLQERYDDYVFNQRISYIQCEQIEELQYVKIEKFTISKISKSGDVITITAKTKLAPNSANLKNAEIKFIFDKGVSENSSVNDLFSDLGRYIKD